MSITFMSSLWRRCNLWHNDFQRGWINIKVDMKLESSFLVFSNRVSRSRYEKRLSRTKNLYTRLRALECYLKLSLYASAFMSVHTTVYILYLVSTDTDGQRYCWNFAKLQVPEIHAHNRETYSVNCLTNFQSK